MFLIDKSPLPWSVLMYRQENSIRPQVFELSGFLLRMNPLITGAARYLIPLLFVSGIVFTVAAAQVVRFSDAWKCRDGRVSGAEATNYDDASWETVRLPHPKSLVAPGGACPMGDSWYRKTFSAEEYQGKKVVIEFLGGMQTVDVYVNGSKVTTHLGGYDPFAIDITDVLSFTSSNVIAVRLNNEANSDFPPGRDSPDFRYWGGLYRDVYLHVSDPLHITHPLVADIPGGAAYL